MKTNLLRTTVLFFIFSFSVFNSKAQWVSIPDTAFVNWLSWLYPQCMNGNLMDTTCPAIVNAPYAIPYRNYNIKDITGITYFDNAQWIDCYDDDLTFIPSLPAGLKAFYCSYNRISSLPTLPPLLETLDCHWNDLNNLPPLPASLLSLNIGDNHFTSLPALPVGLRSLTCYSNPLPSLPALPDSLTTLGCLGIGLDSLPALPAGLVSLSCSNNDLTSLPPLPNKLKYLTCYSNDLTGLAALPDSLLLLWCYNNPLTTLPALPAGLTDLNCDNNQLTTLPALPEGLTNLKCDHNQLTSLPELPNSLEFLYCNDNLNLTCLPHLKQVVELRFYNTGIACVPGYGNVTNSSPPIDSLPLCDIFNTNNCSIFWNISGKAYQDENTNCIKDGSDGGMINVPVELRSNGTLLQKELSLQTGSYSFDTDSFDTYVITIDTANLPFIVSCPVNGVDTVAVTALDSLHYDVNFAFECKPGFDLIAKSILSGRFRPASYSNVHISAGDNTSFYGVYCAAGVSGAVTVTMTGAVSYISPAAGALTPTVSGNVLTYNIADFGSVNFFSDFNFIVQTDTAAALGSQICFTVSVTPTGDNNPANNTRTHCFIVRNSYDPNDKQVYPLSDIDVNGEQWLTYTVNFQNTGTDTAIHIYVTDTLDADLDVSTFQLLAYSHQPMVQIKENAVRFNFPNIMLPDSNVNEPLSHGYVQYKIKLKDNLPIGTQINNTAFIYFDFNEPVVTNTTTNTIAVVSGIAASHEPRAVRIYPNPASDVVTISVDEGMIGGTAIVTDVTGRKIAAVKLTAVNGQLTTENFANGVYFVTVTDKEGRSATKKLVIQK